MFSYCSPCVENSLNAWLCKVPKLILPGGARAALRGMLLQVSHLPTCWPSSRTLHYIQKDLKTTFRVSTTVDWVADAKTWVPQNSRCALIALCELCSLLCGRSWRVSIKKPKIRLQIQLLKITTGMHSRCAVAELPQLTHVWHHQHCFYLQCPRATIQPRNQFSRRHKTICVS